MKRCEQIKCSFYLRGGCMPCKKCKAEPYNINTNCQACTRCESEEGEIRFGEDNQSKKEVELWQTQ